VIEPLLFFSHNIRGHEMGNLTYVSLVRCGGAHLGKLVIGVIPTL
jgi:hypothetical protein